MSLLVAKKNFDDNYVIDKKIGNGRFGNVYKIYSINNNLIFSVKILNKKLVDYNKILNEIEIMKKLDHPHIIKFYDFYEDDNSYYILMEYIEKGDLYEFIYNDNVIDENNARHIFCQLISCIEYCHSQLIVHNDIKLENILVSDEKKLDIKLCDFGLSSRIKIGKLHNIYCGSLEYIAPEIINQKPYDPMKVDIWSCAIVLYCLLCNEFPWCSEENETRHNLKKISKKIKNFEFNYDNIKNNIIKDLFIKIFISAEKRLSIKDIKKHPWIRGYEIPAYFPIPEKNYLIDINIVNDISFYGFEVKNILESVYYNFNNIENTLYNSIKNHKNNLKKINNNNNDINTENEIEKKNNEKINNIYRTFSVDNNFCFIEDINKEIYSSNKLMN